jgi:adenine-specific DNA-methyltransferase
VAAVYESKNVSPGRRVAFENHLNFYHARGRGLPRLLARGLAAYLNSSLVDHYFRQFSGHTQVNATDLRRLGYPSRADLERLGARIADESFPSQRELDDLVREELLSMGDDPDPIQAKQRMDETLDLLEAIGMPRAQLNERSALTLLAILDLAPGVRWAKASSPLRGITPIMDFAREHYGKNYAPNTRETIRRQTMHQFVDAGIAIPNPDDPDRAVNSPDYVYQIEASVLELIRSFGKRSWKKNLATYLSSTETLRQKYAQERKMRRIAIKMPGGVSLNLSAGGQNILIKEVIEEFCPRFTPGGALLYVGDTGEKLGFFEPDALAALGVTVDEHGKMPDVLVHHVAKDWLVIIEAVTSHGPVNPKRRGELKAMFGQSSAGLVFVTAFLDRKAMLNYLTDIAWETEVWTAADPSHLIHFNGERFLGPY